MPKKSKKRLRRRTNVTRKRGGSKQMEQIFLNFVKGIIEQNEEETGFIINKDYSEIIKIHIAKATNYISKHLYKASHTYSASLGRKYKNWNSAIRAIQKHFGNGSKSGGKGAELQFINYNITNNKLILTNKGKRFLETHLNKSKQPNIPNAPSASIFQLPPPSAVRYNKYSTIDSELKNYKNRLLLSLKENEMLKKENNDLKKHLDYFSKKDKETEIQLENLVKMHDDLYDNESALKKQVDYLQERNKELQDQLDFYSGSENILSLTSKSKELLEN